VLRLAIALAALVAGCDRPATESAPVAIDLVRRIAATLPPPPTRVVDVLEPDATRHLTDGFAPAETTADGEAVAWLTRRHAIVEIEAGAVPVDVVLRLVLVGDGAHAGEVELRAGRRRLARVRVGAGRNQTEVSLSAAVQTPGRNRLELLVVRGAVGRRSGRGAGRVGFARLDVVRPAMDAQLPVARDGILELPAGTRAEAYVTVPPGARLALKPDQPLDVRVDADGVPPRRLDVVERHVRRAADGDAGGSASPMPDVPPDTPVRVTLEAPRDGAATVESATVTAPAEARPAAPPRALARNVILYVADTLRADHLGCYGYAHPTSPRLDAFARDAVLFERVVAQAPWTRPAVGSILTGLLPPDHGAVSISDALRAGVPTMATLLEGAGLATGAIVTNLNVTRIFGFARGFDTFTHLREDEMRLVIYATAAEVNAQAEPWLAQHAGEPFFLWLHASDPHAPYRSEPGGAAARLVPPDTRPGDEALVTLTMDDPTKIDVARMVAFYDGDVAELDAGFGALLDALDRHGLADSTAVVFVADHGEEFAEHGGFEHGRTLFQEVVHVPLLIRVPGVGGARVRGGARQVDVLPTVLALLGLPIPDGLAGEPLLDADGAPIAKEREAFTHTRMRRDRGHELVGWVHGTTKVIVDRDRRAPMLFDLAADPREQRDVAAERPVAAGYGWQSAASVFAAAPSQPAPVVPLDPETERRLQALGYLDRRTD